MIGGVVFDYLGVWGRVEAGLRAGFSGGKFLALPEDQGGLAVLI